ncbi:META domain-containing protein [Flavobacterium sp. '19STA2R22 D10 B1']|uniref:META domain-containing protein n=1 Tax=Flavobacterium aerium TaxID=3037261 RepID=UPI00278C0C2B|nr:META domain-containing protein [Flavobacterium sp. '19STA2R22 D10 B1']
MKKSIFASMVLVFTIALTSCNSMKKVSSTDGLTNNEWELATLNGAEPNRTEDFLNGLPYLNFTKDNSVNGSSGCNRLFGPYDLKANGEIKLDKMGMTRMACPGKGESKFMQALNKVTSLKIKKNKLVLMEGTNEVITMTPKK